MKKLFFIVGMCFTALLTAQQKPESLTFTHKLVYELSSEQNEIPNTIISKQLAMYIAHKAIILETNSGTLLFKDGSAFWVRLGAFDNQIYFSPKDYFEIDLLGFKLTPQTEQTSNTNQCTWYKLQLYENNKENQEGEEIDICEICIDTKNQKDNALVFPPHNIRGLIKEIHLINESYNWTLVKEEAINKSFLFDKEAIDAQREARKKQWEEYYNYQPTDSIASTDTLDAIDSAFYSEAYAYDPLYYATFSGINMDMSYKLLIYAERIHSVINDQISNLKEYEGDGLNRKQIIRFLKKHYESSVKNLLKAKIISKEESKQLKGVFKDLIKKAEAFDPKSIPMREQTTYEDYNYDTVKEAAEGVTRKVKYTSAYKNLEITDNITLALDSFSDEEDMLAYAPTYCKAYKNKVPKFENEKLKLHITNYLGQLCDLYLYPYTYLVDFKGSIDSLRKSWLEIEKLRPTLSKQDTQLLLEFMESLD
ncbi:hypothetical protein ACILFS_05375 [Capnocytophaga canimorsus]|uniref:hypothetical protein n=1 Tax=Capnocytophaga canimorsus TaxID=28188 RepID=UPI0037D5981D